MPILSIGTGRALLRNATGILIPITWNPSDKSANITLSNGNLTANATLANVGVRSVAGKSSGKWYWEIKVTAGGSAQNMVGIGNSAAALGSPGMDANGWGYKNSGEKYNSGAGFSYGSAWGSLDVISVALDMDNGKVWVAKNGTWQSGNPAAGTDMMYIGLTGTMYAMWGTGEAGSLTAVANFGATAFVYTPPTGFGGLTA